MTFKEFKKLINEIPDNDLKVRIEFPIDNNISEIIDVGSVEWDESDFIISFYEY